MADSLDFQIAQGADWAVQLVFKNDDGSVQNLTGCAAHMQIRAFPLSPVAIVDLSTAAGTMTINGPLGQINWTVPGATTLLYQPPAALSQPNPLNPNVVPFGYWDLFIQWPGGALIKELYGQVSLLLDITRPF